MHRREFIALAGGALALPVAARAQRHFKIGLLDTGIGPYFSVPFIRKLGELGYVDGRNATIENRNAEGSTERLKVFAAGFVQEPVDVIVTAGTPAGFAAKQATGKI